MCAGISSEESDEGMTLPDQISKAHSDANNAEAKAKQATMKVTHLSKTLKSVERDMKKEEKSAAKLASKKEQSEAAVEALKTKLSQINFSEDEFNSLDNQKVELENNVSSLRETVETFSAQLQGRLSFNYSDPVRGFDRSKVKGLVAKLIQVKESAHATALEVVAGGKLYQVVVDEAITGKALLNNGRLQRRVTIIPLDKINARRITDSTANQASSIANSMGATASPAIELVGFDEEVRSAVEYVFGSTLVVDGMDAANKICDATKTRTVTLQGDVYDPSGTISGGSSNNLGSTLVKLTELTIASSELEMKETQLKQVASKLHGMASLSKQYGSLSDKLEIADAELSGIQKHLSQTSYGMLSEQFNSMSKEIEDANIEIEAMQKEKDVKWNLYNELKDKEADLTRQREDRLKEIDQKVKDAKETAAVKSKISREADSTSQTLLLELDSLKAEVYAAEEAVVAAEKALQEANAEEAKLQIKVGEMKSNYDEAKTTLDEVEEKMATYSSELKALSKERATLTKHAETAELEAKKLSIKVAKFHKERGSAERFVANMMKKYSWIETEKDAFGVLGGDYDFEATDPSEMSRQLKGLKDEQSSLSKKINKKVMGMIEKAEGEYTELLRKRKVVENDKKKIQAVIEELDIKKKSELERTWVKVNRDFGSIFSTLLPGASAKLEPPEGLNAWEGLQVKVAFGGVWKQSLSELSGGQRSLLALSLILSLLLFKPAPMYILDEVDAALDLSHTQNIGNMLKTHFSQSQFIVVSLKEGMFNNANVIFRTKFVDGVSTVTKTMGVGSSTKARALTQSATTENEVASPARKRVAGRRKGGKENSTIVD
uniref:SMC hinge domain-containing protein n=1 Tax=Attheya septentrionalis TaxID=420275 RepID=A0A7S2XJV8_9STRA